MQISVGGVGVLFPAPVEWPQMAFLQPHPDVGCVQNLRLCAIGMDGRQTTNRACFPARFPPAKNNRISDEKQMTLELQNALKEL